MNEEHPDVRVTPFADSAQSPDVSRRTFPRGQADEAGETTTAAKPNHISDKSDQRCCREKTNTRNRPQTPNRRHLLGERLELKLHGAHACLELTDLRARFEERATQRLGKSRVGVLHETVHLRYHLLRAHGDEPAQFAEDCLGDC